MLDSNGVGATRRGARPGRPRGKKIRLAVDVTAGLFCTDYIVSVMEISSSNWISLLLYHNSLQMIHLVLDDFCRKIFECLFLLFEFHILEFYLDFPVPGGFSGSG